MAWWDGRAAWIVDEYELLRGIGSVIGCAETPYGPRLAQRLQNSSERRGTYRHLLRRTAAISHGTMMPMGVEFAASADMKRRGGEGDRLAAPENCSAGLAGGNPQCQRPDRQAGSARSRWRDSQDFRRRCCRYGAPAFRCRRCALRHFVSPVILINTDLRSENPLPISLDPLPATAGMAATAQQTIFADRAANAALGAGEIRLIGAQPTAAVKRRIDMPTAKAAALPRIVIDNVAPAIDAGRFAAKRIVGESITVSADVFADGHEDLRSKLLWRATDKTEWRRSTMAFLNNDRWQAAISPDRIGRHEFTVEAWCDSTGRSAAT